MSTDEKRLYTRTQSNLSVYIYYNKKRITEGKVINISVGGILVETEETGLIVHSFAEVEFLVNDNHRLFGIRFPVVVRWLDDMHIGFSFETLDKGTEELIMDSMNNNIQSGKD